jgi:hypothetical protein
MSKKMNEHKKEEKTLYTCPCGFCSYDLMEFLKHPYMEDVTEKNEGTLEKLEQERENELFFLHLLEVSPLAFSRDGHTLSHPLIASTSL